MEASTKLHIILAYKSCVLHNYRECIVAELFTKMLLRIRHNKNILVRILIASHHRFSQLLFRLMHKMSNARSDDSINEHFLMAN